MGFFQNVAWELNPYSTPTACPRATLNPVKTNKTTALDTSILGFPLTNELANDELVETRQNNSRLLK